MCLMKYGLNLTIWGKFSEKFLENHEQLRYLFGNLKPGMGVKQIFQVRVWACSKYSKCLWNLRANKDLLVGWKKAIMPKAIF